jgi:hypothetical protein
VQRFHVAGSESVLDFVLLASQFRNAMVAYDGIVVCMERSAAEAALIISRSLFETRLYVGWILQPRTEEEREYRAHTFHVASLREDRYWNSREIPGTPEFEEYRTVSDPRFPMATDERIASYRDHLAELDRLFAMPHNARIVALFEKLKNPKNGRDPEWYRVGPGACASLADMAHRLGLKHRYLSAYRYTSHFTHGSFAYQGVEIRTKGAVIQPLRQVDKLWTPFAIGAEAFDDVLGLLMERYRPTEVENLKTARRRWWKALVKPPDIRVDETLVPLRGGPVA